MCKSEKSVRKVLDVHYKYAVESVKSIKKFHDIPCILYTNIKDIVTGFDKIIHTEGVVDRWAYKYTCLLDSPFDQTLHIDCDTYVCNDFIHAFTLLDRFDLILPLSPWYWSSNPLGVEKCFPEFAGGFLLWKKNNKMQKLFSDVLAEVSSRIAGCDEPYLRKVLYYSEVRFSVIPWEYTCVFNLPGYVTNNVKILHGKYTDINKVASAINASKTPRFYTGSSVLEIDHRRKKGLGISKEIIYG